MRGTDLLESLLKKNTILSKMALNNVLRVAIPFNAPHGFSFKKISDYEVQISLPNFKLNHNHLGGMHACAIATLGEFCAGMTLAKHLGFQKYRFILSELSVKYHLQGRTGLTGIAQITPERIAEIKHDLTGKDKILVDHNTEIMNKHGEKVADVKTTWQIKDWTKVQLK